MSKKMLAALAVGGLALAGYAAAAGNGALPDSISLGLGANAKCAAGLNATGAEDQAEQRVALCERAGRRLGLPAFHAGADGSVTGKWVSFSVDNATGALGAYTSRGPFADAVVFTSIALAPAGPMKDVARGGAWLAGDDGLRAVAFDAPNAYLGFRETANETATLTFTVADGIALSPLPDNVSGPNATGLVLSEDGHQAALRMIGHASYSVNGQVVTVTLGKGDAVVFHIRGYPRLLAHEEAALRGHARAEKVDARLDAQLGV